VKRILLTLALIANSFLLYAIGRGLNIGDTESGAPEVQQLVGTHMLIGLGALTFAALVHAVVLTWFMGTGRFLEETSNAYSLPDRFYNRSQQLKYQLLPGMTICLLLLVATGALGAVADPATPASLAGTLGVTDARIHLVGAIVLFACNMIMTLLEYRAVVGNSKVIDQVLAEVHRIRKERGLPVG
jgi:hypothetical protein